GARPLHIESSGAALADAEAQLGSLRVPYALRGVGAVRRVFERLQQPIHEALEAEVSLDALAPFEPLKHPRQLRAQCPVIDLPSGHRVRSWTASGLHFTTFRRGMAGIDALYFNGLRLPHREKTAGCRPHTARGTGVLPPPPTTP